jgi:hypothetical protein
VRWPALVTNIRLGFKKFASVKRSSLLRARLTDGVKKFPDVDGRRGQTGKAVAGNAVQSSGHPVQVCRFREEGATVKNLFFSASLSLTQGSSCTVSREFLLKGKAQYG